MDDNAPPLFPLLPYPVGYDPGGRLGFHGGEELADQTRDDVSAHANVERVGREVDSHVARSPPRRVSRRPRTFNHYRHSSPFGPFIVPLIVPLIVPFVWWSLPSIHSHSTNRSHASRLELGRRLFF